MRGSHGLSARRARRTKSRGPKGLHLEVGARRAPRLLVSHICSVIMSSCVQKSCVSLFWCLKFQQTSVISCSNLMSFLKNAFLMKSTFGHMASAQNMLPEYGHRSVVGLGTAICPNITCATAAAQFLDGDKSCCCIPSSSRIFFCGCESGDAIAQHYIW